MIINDEYYMKMAIDEAKKGVGFVNPNPMVGAVIVRDGEILARDYHGFYGDLHAERKAILKCENVEGATLYVTLELCCHHGKTPPCTDIILQSKIKKVVVAMLDPNPKMNGKGVEILRNNGIEVVVGVLEDKSRALNEVFCKYILELIWS